MESRYREGKGKKQNIVSTRDLLSLTLQSPEIKAEGGLTLAVAHLLERGLVAERVLARLDDERETGGDGLGGLRRLGLLRGGHREFLRSRVGGRRGWMADGALAGCSTFCPFDRLSTAVAQNYTAAQQGLMSFRRVPEPLRRWGFILTPG